MRTVRDIVMGAIDDSVRTDDAARIRLDDLPDGATLDGPREELEALGGKLTRRGTDYVYDGEDSRGAWTVIVCA